MSFIDERMSIPPTLEDALRSVPAPQVLKKCCGLEARRRGDMNEEKMYVSENELNHRHRTRI